MPPCQSAYRAGHSTETALVKVQSDILLNMDQQKVTQLVLIDLPSAFDAVENDVLLNIMNGSFGVSSTTLNWFSFYCQSRSQRILSMVRRLSPVFPASDQHGKLELAYADVNQVYCCFHPDSLYSICESMELCIRDISSWMQGNKLKINNSKTEYILIGTPQQQATCTNTAIDIGGYEVRALNCVRNLGAYFDYHMSMEEHVKFKCRAAFAQPDKIGKIRKYLD